jgi:hypothetical protein
VTGLANEEWTFTMSIKGKAVLSQAWSGPEGSRKLRFSDFLTTAQYGGKVVSLVHWLHLPPGNTPGNSFLLEGELTPGPQCDQKDLCQCKIPITPSGIEPATFRLVAQYLNHCDTAVLHVHKAHIK